MNKKYNMNNPLASSRLVGWGRGFISLLLFASCSSEVAEVYPDGSDEINISLSKGISTRAAGVYRAWSADTDPTTMGVIAFVDATPITPYYIYNNTTFSEPASGNVWDTTGTKAKWSDYSVATDLDFFAYMPHMAGATISKSENTYTLTLQNVPGVSDKPYLVATTPVHYASAYGNTTPVQMQMDQLMTAFEFQFQLGDDMSKLRTFKITKVKMSEVPASATVAQAYTFESGIWSKGETTTTNISHEKTYTDVTGSAEIGYPSSNDYVTFSNMLYMLPFSLSEHSPKIEVTYDVYDQDGYKTDSRTSGIVLNEANFGTLSSVQSAHKNIVKIKIVPTSLHVLSDADQSTSGYLVVGE